MNHLLFLEAIKPDEFYFGMIIAIGIIIGVGVSKKEKIGYYIKSIGICILVVLIILFASNMLNFSSLNMQLKQTNGNTYEQKVMSVEDIERAYPIRFLTITNSQFVKDGIFFIDYYAKGTIQNNATVEEYKDAVIQIEFLTKTNTQLSAENHTLYEFYPAHLQKDFSIKISPPKDCEKISLSIIQATSIN